MAVTLAENTITNFEKLSGFDLSGYFLDWSDFVKNNYKNITNYYQGSTNELDQVSVKFYENLKYRSQELSEIITNTNKNLDTFDYWNLIEFIDDIKSKIGTIGKISKFLRTAKYEGFNESNLAQDYLVTDMDTPENVAAKDRTDVHNEWVDIYVKNNIREVDYKAGEGGYNVQLGKKSLQNIVLDNVVDNLYGEKIYGIDIDNSFVYEDNDVKVLGYRDTARQSIITLGRLNKGDIPEFPSLGVSPDTAIGSNIGVVSTQFLAREMKEAFSVDSTLLNFNINNIEIKGTTLYVNYEVQTFYDFVVKDNRQVK